MSGLAWTALLGLLVVGALRAVAPWTAVGRGAHEALPFVSGWRPAEHALSRYHARWYVASIVFLAFDIEMLFMYPWAVVVGRLGAGAVVEMFVFLGVLLVAVAWARREGAFRWS